MIARYFLLILILSYIVTSFEHPHVSRPRESFTCNLVVGLCYAGGVGGAIGCLFASVFTFGTTLAVCVGGVALATPACIAIAYVSPACCPVSCPGGFTETCCFGSEMCVDANQGFCCEASRQNCKTSKNHQCCTENEQCVKRGEVLGCCPVNPIDKVCGGDHCCTDTQTCIENMCCEDSNKCGGTCCGEGSDFISGGCANGKCCSLFEPACGRECCSGTCLIIGNTKQCCPFDRIACGNVCCSKGEFCEDGICTNSNCDNGQVPCIYKDSTGIDKMICCNSDTRCCEGKCCPDFNYLCSCRQYTGCVHRDLCVT